MSHAGGVDVDAAGAGDSHAGSQRGITSMKSTNRHPSNRSQPIEPVLDYSLMTLNSTMKSASRTRDSAISFVTSTATSTVNSTLENYKSSKDMVNSTVDSVCGTLGSCSNLAKTSSMSAYETAMKFRENPSETIKSFVPAPLTPVVARFHTSTSESYKNVVAAQESLKEKVVHSVQIAKDAASPYVQKGQNTVSTVSAPVISTVKPYIVSVSSSVQNISSNVSDRVHTFSSNLSNRVNSMSSAVKDSTNSSVSAVRGYVEPYTSYTIATYVLPAYEYVEPYVMPAYCYVEPFVGPAYKYVKSTLHLDTKTKESGSVSQEEGGIIVEEINGVYRGQSPVPAAVKKDDSGCEDEASSTNSYGQYIEG